MDLKNSSEVIGLQLGPTATEKDAKIVHQHIITLKSILNVSENNITLKGQAIQNRYFDGILAGILLVLSVYLFIATVYYHVKHAHRSLRWTNALCTASVTLILFESAWFQLEIHLDQVHDSLCIAYSATNVVMATVNRVVVYAVFWIRQRSFYRKFPLQSIRQETVVCFSNILLVTIIVFACMQIVALGMIPIYGNESGCATGKPSDFLQVFVPLVFGVIALFQILLLTPVLYPLVRHIHAKKTGQPDQLESIAIRLIICTTVYLVTDVIFLALSVHEPIGASFSLLAICFAFNTVINVALMLLSFHDYKLRLIPFLKPFKLHIHERNVVTPSNKIQLRSISAGL